MKNRSRVLFACITFFAFLGSGCSTAHRRVLPEDLFTKATVNNMSEIRTYLGSKDSLLQRNLMKALEKEDPEYTGPDGVKNYPLLAISGGAANGAYGAGLMKGWSAEGSRPEFKVVTGVSTGAITAPFVFLGEEYDKDLEMLYTTMSTKDVMSIRGPIRALTGDSFASNKPLEKLIKKWVTDDILEKIAAEYKKGRRLYVGTTNLDAEKFIVWDMGAIAVKGDKKLFGEVIRASASIPIVFPPVFIEVEADGKTYDEMHVDGGTIAQAFTVYSLVDPYVEGLKNKGIDLSKIRAKYYIIRNGYVKGDYAATKDNLPSIAGRALDTMINTQGIGDTYRIYSFMNERGNDFYLAYIPSDYRPAKKEEFDPDQMKKLFDRGYKDAVNGYEWHVKPPGMDE